MSEDNSMFDKIIEFGMGMTMARQFPQMMDMAMPHPQQSPTTPPAIRTGQTNIYIANNGQQAGPFTEDEVKQLVANGIIIPGTLVWMPGMAQWASANQVAAINRLLLLFPDVAAAPASVQRPPQKELQSAHQVVPPQDITALREEVEAALAQLGYSNANSRKKIDEVLAAQPKLDAAEIVKEVLKKL